MAKLIKSPYDEAFLMNKPITRAKAYDPWDVSTFDDVVKIASFFLKTRLDLVPATLRNSDGKINEADLVMILLYGKELGFSPQESLSHLIVIHNKVSVGSEGTMSLIYRKFPDPYINILETTNERAVVVMARNKDAPKIKIAFSMEDAKKAGLTSNPSYRKYPAVMLRWRALKQLARMVFPDLGSKIYTEEEVMSFEETDDELIITGDDYEVQERSAPEPEETPKKAPKPVPKRAPKRGAKEKPHRGRVPEVAKALDEADFSDLEELSEQDQVNQLKLEAMTRLKQHCIEMSDGEKIAFSKKNFGPHLAEKFATDNLKEMKEIYLQVMKSTA